MHTRTEGDAPDSATEERKVTFGAGSQPQHSSTLPVNNTSGSRSGQNTHKPDDIAIDERNETSEESNMTSETLTSEPAEITGNANGNEGLKKRHASSKLMAKMPWKKHGLQETGPEDSQAHRDSKSHKPKKHYTIGGQLRATVFGSWINLL